MKKHDTDTSKKRLFISLAALAIFATAPLPQAQAAVIGSVQVDATFRSNGQPNDNEISHATWQAAWNKCHWVSPNTRSLSYHGTSNWFMDRNGLHTVVYWNCHNTATPS